MALTRTRAKKKESTNCAEMTHERHTRGLQVRIGFRPPVATHNTRPQDNKKARVRGRLGSLAFACQFGSSDYIDPFGLMG